MQLSKEQLKQIEEYLDSLPEEERIEKEKEIQEQLKQPQQCPFCLMSEEKIKTTKVYEDEHFIAVLEINPANEGHTVLIPKKHITDLSKLTDLEMESFSLVLKRVTHSLSKISGSLNIIYSQGAFSGQRFDHMNIQLIPRKDKDKVNITWQPQKAEEKDLEKIRELIIQNFPKKEIKVEPVNEDELKTKFKRFKSRQP